MIDSKYSHLKFKVLPTDFKYVLFENKDQFFSQVSLIQNQKGPFALFITEEEYSLIGPSEIKFTMKKEVPDWVGLRIIGDMPFGSVQGLIANIATTLFKEKLGVCVISTFLTDFFFIKSKNLSKVKELLIHEGWKVE